MTDRWSISSYQSGTHVVHRLGFHEPWFYVYEAPNRSRYETCEDLCAWLNGEGPRPSWADDLIRTSEEKAVHAGLNENGVMLPIMAVGPMLESEPGRGDWTPDPAFADDRSRLMDRLCGIGGQQ